LNRSSRLRNSEQSDHATAYLIAEAKSKDAVVLQHNGIPLEGGIQIAIRINWAQAVLILILINQTRKERNTAYNGA